MDKTTNNPSDHELNAVLARVAGVAIHGDKVKNKWWCHGNLGGWAAWNPLHDANQMERVKVKLRELKFNYFIEWDTDTNTHSVTMSQTLVEFNEGSFTGPIDYHEHESELRAFALAVYAMEQSQKGTT